MINKSVGMGVALLTLIHITQSVFLMVTEPINHYGRACRESGSVH